MKTNEKHLRLIIIMPVFVYFALNITGFCYKDWKFYSSKYLINQYIELQLSDVNNDIPNEIRTPDDFLKEYGDCCQIVSGNQAFNWFFRVFGYGMWDIYIRYTFPRNGKESDRIVIYSVDCCGRAWRKQAD
ncbi:hypothetical protein [Rhizobium sp. BR 362]|uniref:hypothetical protein n=1 Tax=Rhizobium sp. BR 362 TaxID=3040670 RepID=UPI002F42EFE8